jgi:hypothetical protein
MNVGAIACSAAQVAPPVIGSVIVSAAKQFRDARIMDCFVGFASSDRGIVYWVRCGTEWIER